MNKIISLEELLPHRKPMLLIDEIVALSENEVTTKKQIHPDAFFLQGHYPNFPIVPGIITCECIFQSGADVTKENGAAKVPVVARIEKAKFRTPIRPGDTVTFVVQFIQQVSHVFFLKGEAKVKDKIVASVSFACALTPEPA